MAQPPMAEYNAEGVQLNTQKPQEKKENHASSTNGHIPEDAKAYEVHFDGEDDPEHPYSTRKVKKWAQVFVACGTSMCVTCTSSMYTATYQQMMAEFGISRELATSGLSLFVFALGLSPMVFSPLSEFYGRRPIYLISMSTFVIWLVPCAVAQNIQTMLVARFINGLTGSAFLSVSGGTVRDLFAQHDLQLPMLFYTLAPFLGPVLGPIFGGFINSFTNWRWTYYVLIIWAVVQVVLIFFLLPETYHPVLLRNKARRLRKETGDERWYAPIERHERSVTQTVIRSCYRPFQLLTLEPMVLNLCLLSALILAILYLFFGAFPLVFENNYGFNQWQAGLTFCSIGLGMCLAVASDPIWTRLYVRKLRSYEEETGVKGASEPEFRLPSSIVGAPLVAIGLFWFGFTTYPNIHWIVPNIGAFIFGIGVVCSFSGIYTFLVDAYPLYAASALAANSFTRSCGAAVFPLFGLQMYERLGYQWATGLLAFLCVAMAPFPYIFYRYGKRIRKRSKFASAK